MYTSSFFNSVKGDRKYKADAFAEYFASFIGNGVFPNPSDGLQTMASTGMTIAVKAGRAWINGYFLRNFDNTPVILATANGTYDRIDRVVLRWSLADRSINIAVKQGVYSSTPTPEPLRRDTDIYELAIADVLVPKGAVTITQANITDTRLNSDLCGIVRGTIEEVDTTTIFNQYNDWYRTFTNEANSEFMDWFDSIRDILDENTAAHLLNMINGKQDRITASGLLKSDGTAITAAVSGVDYASGDALSKINRIIVAGNGEVGDAVSLLPSGSVVRAAANGADTLAYSQDKTLGETPGIVTVRLTDTKFANVYAIGYNLYCVISDINGETITYGTAKSLGSTGNYPSSLCACKYETTATDCKVCAIYNVGAARCYCFSVTLATNFITVGVMANLVDAVRINLACVSLATNNVVFTGASGASTYMQRVYLSGLTVTNTWTSIQPQGYVCKPGSLAALSATLAIYVGATSAGVVAAVVYNMNTSTVEAKSNLTTLFGFNSQTNAVLQLAANKVLILGGDAAEAAPYAYRKAVIATSDSSGNLTFSAVFTIREAARSIAPVTNIINCGGYYKAYSSGASVIIRVKSDMSAVESMRVSDEMIFGNTAPWADAMSGFDILTWFESSAGRQIVAHRYNGSIIGVVESKNGGELTIAARGEYAMSSLAPGTDYYLQRSGKLGAGITLRKMGTALTNTRLLLREMEI